ncbi:hypothetical protein RN001_002039 [Aquatica leii]|uniref:Uncharacterized protein n=1 Tax=Aquatica leii TaxID=1421715 RepID=A0AAN7QN87_9COLE|nr:hypothetical protein RN001_002039 [Aquatica leii]
MTNYTEINLAKEMIPQYEGGSRNLSYFLQQCDKFINTYKNSNKGEENCTLNKLLFEICCSKLINAARDILATCDCSTWSNVKFALLNQTNENYDTYYEKIKGKLQYLLEHISIHEQDVNLKIYKTNLYTRKALDTFKAGLLEPYQSLEDCLLQFRNYDNHKQLVSFLNFIRQKTPIKSAHKSNTQNQNFRTPTSRNNAYFNNTNQYNPNYNQYRNQNINQNYGQNYNQNRNHFPSAPINVQSRPLLRRVLCHVDWNQIKDTEHIVSCLEVEEKKRLRGKVVNVITNFDNNKTENNSTPQNRFIKTLMTSTRKFMKTHHDLLITKSDKGIATISDQITKSRAKPVKLSIFTNLTIYYYTVKRKGDKLYIILSKEKEIDKQQPRKQQAITWYIDGSKPAQSTEAGIVTVL